MAQLDVALQNLREALRLAPNNPDCYVNLAKYHYFLGEISEAILLFEKAIRLDPGNWQAHYYLANSLVRDEMVERAISHYETAIKLNPQYHDAKQNLAMAYVSMKNYSAALPYLEVVAPADPNHAELQGHLAEAYLELGKVTQAINQFKIAVSLDPNRAEWHHNLAVLLLRNNEPEFARQHFQKSIDIYPDNPTAQHMLLALNKNNTTTANTAPAAYVSDLFDQYASYYNKHVTEKLHYQVPALLRQAISKVISPTTKLLNILDLGCGTGLCAIYFNDLANFLVGVDLSASMLQHANSLKAYDGLCQCNILEVIPGYGRSVFDIILAADVLVYIGELDQVFKSVCSALRSNGMFAFTVEKLEDAQDFHLQPSGRFAHNKKYIEKLAQQHHLSIKIADQIVLREQDNIAVQGLLFVLCL